MLHTDQSIHKACSQASKIIKTSNCNHKHLTMESSSQSRKPIYFHLEQRLKKKEPSDTFKQAI